MTTHVNQQDAIIRCEPARRLLDRYSGDDHVEAVFPVEPYSVSNIACYTECEYDFHRMSGRLQAMCDAPHQIAEHKPQPTIRQYVKAGSCEIQLQELLGSHSHAAGQWRSHGVNARDKFGDNQSDSAAAVKRFG